MPTDYRKALWSAPGALLGLLWAMPPLIKWLLLLMLIDFASGFLGALGRGEVSSTASRKGAMKKAQALLLVAAMKALCMAISLDVDLSAMLAGYFCLTEAISIAENAARAGLPIPAFLTRVLAAMKEQADPKTEPAKGDS